MEKRESGLDLLRVIALLFVVTFHSLLNNGYYFEAQTGIAMLLAVTVPIFLTLLLAVHVLQRADAAIAHIGRGNVKC